MLKVTYTYLGMYIRNKCLHHTQRRLHFSTQNPNLLLKLELLHTSFCHSYCMWGHSAAHRVYFYPQNYSGTKVLVVVLLFPMHKKNLLKLHLDSSSDLKPGLGATDITHVTLKH